MDMLWYLSLWHVLAKLRMHTETTVKILESVTYRLGKSLRSFKRKSADIDTRELPREEAARGRREAAIAAATGVAKSTQAHKKRKLFNLTTFKWHNIGHYIAAILRLGPTDIYTTQTVSLSIVYHTSFPMSDTLQLYVGRNRA